MCVFDDKVMCKAIIDRFNLTYELLEDDFVVRFADDFNIIKI